MAAGPLPAAVAAALLLVVVLLSVALGLPVTLTATLTHPVAVAAMVLPQTPVGFPLPMAHVICPRPLSFAPAASLPRKGPLPAPLLR